MGVAVRAHSLHELSMVPSESGSVVQVRQCILEDDGKTCLHCDISTDAVMRVDTTLESACPFHGGSGHIFQQSMHRRR